MTLNRPLVLESSQSSPKSSKITIFQLCDLSSSPWSIPKRLQKHPKTFKVFFLNNWWHKWGGLSVSFQKSSILNSVKKKKTWHIQRGFLRLVAGHLKLNNLCTSTMTTGAMGIGWFLLRSDESDLVPWDLLDILYGFGFVYKCWYIYVYMYTVRTSYVIYCTRNIYIYNMYNCII